MAADTEHGWTVRPLATHESAINAIVGTVFRAEPVAITGGRDGVLNIWSLRDGRNVLSLLGSPWEDIKAVRETDRPAATALAAHGEMLYIGWTDGTVSLLDLVTGNESAGPIEVHDPGAVITALLPADLPDGRQRVVSAGSDGRVVVITSPAGEQDREPLRAGGSPVWSLAASGSLIFACTSDRRIESWRYDGTTPVPQTTHPGLQGSKSRPLISALAGSDQQTLVLADVDHILVTNDALDTPRRFDSGVGDVDVLTVCELARRPVAAVGSATGTIALLDPLTAPDDERPGALAIDAESGATTLSKSIRRRRDRDPEPAPLLVGPIDIGEPVAGISSVQLDGRDVLVAGGRDGGVYVVEPAAPPVSDKVELQDDVPATDPGHDPLQRNPLAQALAVRLERRHEEGKEASFLVHLDGRWGSGKTTVLNFVAKALGDDWTVVRYNAWRESRIGPPWWTLLTALRDELLRRKSPAGRLRLWCREMLEQRILRASGLPATVLLVLIAAGVFFLIRPSGGAGETLTTVQGVAAALTALATLFAGAQFVARFFGWHSPRGAKAFQDLDTNPMDRVAEHFSWLVAQEKRPIAYFIDDIDRCRAEDVVELLENVQTLVRDAAESQAEVLSPCFVVAGDGAWIRNAFEEHYADFADQIAEPGRPLGYLFLAKIFQLTLPVPRIGPVRQAKFFRELLGLEPQAATSPVKVAEARQAVAAAPNDEAQQAALAEFPRAVREEVAGAAVARQTELGFAAATEHRLTGFAPLLPDNPRAVKRFLNAFAMTRSVRTIEGQAIPTSALALWTILQTRWPLLADALAEHPEWMLPNAALIPEPIRDLLDNPEVQAVLHFADGGPLTPDQVRACSGR